MDKEMTFWDHLDVLRGTVMRSGVAFVLSSVLAFVFKDMVFNGVVFAPLDSSFWLYRLVGQGGGLQLINIEVTGQLTVHLKVAAMVGLIVSMPYMIFELWRFVAPALYERELRNVRKAFLSATLLFYMGVLFSYFFIFPVTLLFFGSYTIGDSVVNAISLGSYISLFTSLMVVMGLVFEFPVLAYLLGKAGILNRSVMVKYRRHSIVAIVFVAALIAPGDPFSLAAVALPLYLLYELSVGLCPAKKD